MSIRTKIIFIEGNVGAGKSTLCSFLKNRPDCQVILEPVDIWKETCDDKQNILQYYFDDQQRYSYTFQSYVLLTRLNKLQHLDFSKKYIFIERSIYSDKFVFAQNLYDTKRMNNMEWVLYCNWFEYMKLSFQKILRNTPQHYVYLSCSSDLCFKRIQERKRKEEAGIKHAYIKQLGDKHEEWLLGCKIPLLKIDASKNFRDNENILEEVINKILDFVENRL